MVFVFCFYSKGARPYSYCGMGGGGASGSQSDHLFFYIKMFFLGNLVPKQFSGIRVNYEGILINNESFSQI